MGQHDYTLANAVNAQYRADLNDALAAIVSRNSGASAPGTTFGNMDWYDTTRGVMRRRNNGNSAWVTRRTEVPSGTTIYVRSDGNDSNSGFGNSASGAFLTVQAAVKHVNVLSPLGDVIVQVQDGTWTISGSAISLPLLQIPGRGYLRGNVTSPQSCTLRGGVSIDPVVNGTNALQGVSAPWRIEGFRIEQPSNSNVCISVNQQDFEVRQIDFGPCLGGWHMRVLEAGRITVVGSISMSAGSANHVIAYRGGTIVYDNGDITLVGSPQFAWTFAYATAGGVISASSLTSHGTPGAGSRYSINGAAIIDVNGQGQNVLPGASAGSVQSGGIYV